MALNYLADKQQIQDIKKFLKPHTLNKLNDKGDYKVNKDTTLPIRGQDATSEKKTK